MKSVREILLSKRVTFLTDIKIYYNVYKKITSAKPQKLKSLSNKKVLL